MRTSRRQTVWSARRLARKLARVAVGTGPAVEPQLREAPVMGEGSWVGLDVHARSVVAGVLDAGSGELRSRRAPTVVAETVAWLQQCPRRCGSPTKRARPGTGLRARARKPGSRARSRHRRGSRAPRPRSEEHT